MFDKYPLVRCGCGGRYVLRVTGRDRFFACIDCGSNKRLDCSEAMKLWESGGKHFVFKTGDGKDDYMIDPTPTDFDPDAYFNFGA